MPPTRWVAALSLVYLGLFSGWFGPIQVLLAEQAEQVSPDHKAVVLGWVLGAGGAVSTVCCPVFGALSDRTRLRMGRRLPWILGGAAGGALSLWVLSLAHDVASMLLSWCGVQLFFNAMFAAVTAAVPDQVPVRRRGLVGGMLAIAQTLGAVLGAGIAAVTGSIASGYLVTIAVLLVLTIPYALGSRDLALPAEHVVPPLRPARFARSFWISPRRHPDFAWAWLTRFLVNTGSGLAIVYLLYYLTDALGYGDKAAASRVFFLTALYAVVTVLTTAVGGHLSDRLGRRKVFVVCSGMVGGVALLVLGGTQSWPGVLIAVFVLGIGYGIYSSVDFALVTQLLPQAQDRAKDLGVINIAATLPQVFAPLLAGAILGVVGVLGGPVDTHGHSWSAGYGAIYGCSFALLMLGAVLVTRIRSVR
jgi:MFS family permease